MTSFDDLVTAGDGTGGDDDRDPVLLRRLLCPHRSRGDREQQSHSQIAPPHPITSSAPARTAGGIVRPSAFAVLRLTVRSNLWGGSTGIAAGLAPLRILSTKPAARRKRSR